MMQRDQCLAVLARHITDEIVVATYSSAFEWLELGERSLNYFSVGAMGLELLARAGPGVGPAGPARHLPPRGWQPSDNLGALVTIAAAAPKNLVHFVVQNGTYEANGSHPIPNKDVDFAAIASAAGFAQVHDFADLKSFEQQAGHVVKQTGPVFATLRVEPAKPLRYDYPKLYDPARRAALKAELASR